MKPPSGWIETTLGEWFHIKHGWAFKGEFFADSGPYVVLTPGNFGKHGGLQERGEREKYYAGEFPSEFLLKRDDLLIVMTDLTQNAPILGSPAFIPKSEKYLHNQRLGKVVDLNEARLRKSFLYYLLNTSHVRAQIKASATGSTVRHTAPDRIYAVKVALPPVQVQDRVAAILSAYDDLIENNTRRIRILEEMAQMIYREWFVNFRFPGHEKVKMVESELGPIPERWSVDNLGSVAEVNELSIKSNDAPERISYIDIASVSTGSIDKKEPMQFSEAPSRARRIVRHGDVIWSTVRPNRRSFAMILSPEPHLVVSTGFAVLTAKKVPYSYLYFTTTTDSFTEYLTNHATGAAYPAVNTKDFQNARLLLPPKPLLDRFHSVAADMLIFQHDLHLKNAALRTTRDLLLPKLISGEVPVEDLEAAAIT